MLVPTKTILLPAGIIQVLGGVELRACECQLQGPARSSKVQLSPARSSKVHPPGFAWLGEVQTRNVVSNMNKL